MRDYYERNRIRERIDDVRYHLAKIPPNLYPPGFDPEAAFKHILDRIPAPEVSYRVDALRWDDTYSDKRPYLPDYHSGASSAILPLTGLVVRGPIGKKRTWKVVCYHTFFSYVLDRFGLKRDPAEQILYEISRTPENAILRYPTEAAAKEAVAGALLKIGLVGPIIDVDEMHELTGYDS